MWKINLTILPHVVAISTAAILCVSCAGTASKTVEETPKPAETEVAEPSAKSENQVILSTEQDYRDAIASAQNDASIMKLYDEFSSNYMMEEDEYLEYADLCKKTGDTTKARDVLWMLYRIKPSKECGEKMSECAYDLSNSDSAVSLLNDMASLIKSSSQEGWDVNSLVDAVSTDEWKSVFYIDSGVFTSVSHVDCDGFTADISSDSLSTSILIDDGVMKYEALVETVDRKVSYSGNEVSDYTGEFYEAIYESEEIKSMKKGEIADEHLVGKFYILMDKIEYLGDFDENGHTTLEQHEDVDGVIYAYDANERQYLYAEGEAVENWVISPNYIGLK